MSVVQLLVIFQQSVCVPSLEYWQSLTLFFNFKGGENHRVVEGNELASEMDGSTAPAWHTALQR